MRFFRRVFLPLAWLGIFSVIAVSLAVLAFDDDDDTDKTGVGLKPTGQVPARESVVERGTIENTLTVQGTIVVDPAAPVKSTHDGVVVHYFVPAGAKVKPGDNIFQIRYEDTPTDGDEDESKPVQRYVNVAAQTAGKIGTYAKAVNEDVAKGEVITSVRRSTFRAVGSIAPLDQYRLLGKPRSSTVTIVGGPRPFTCDDLTVGDPDPAAASGDGPATVDDVESGEMDGDPGGGQGGGVAISCRVPGEVRVFDGLAMSMEVDAGRAEDVLVVPVTAVRGLIGSGSVWVPDPNGGEPVETPVRLGLSDGSMVEITKGLAEGDPIVEFVPGGESFEDGGDEDFE